MGAQAGFLFHKSARGGGGILNKHWWAPAFLDHSPFWSVFLENDAEIIKKIKLWTLCFEWNDRLAEKSRQFVREKKKPIELKIIQYRVITYVLSQDFNYVYIYW